MYRIFKNSIIQPTLVREGGRKSKASVEGVFKNIFCQSTMLFVPSLVMETFQCRFLWSLALLQRKAQKKLHATNGLELTCHFLAPIRCFVSLTESWRFSMLMRNHKVLFLKTMRLCKGCRRTIPCPDLLRCISSDPFPRKTMMKQV